MPRVAVLIAIAVLAACAGSDEPVAEPVPEASTTTAPRPEGYDSDWCVSARRIAAESSVMDAVDPGDADAVREAITEMLAEAEEAAPLAPPEIAADVRTALESFREIDAALAEVDYDLLRVDLSGIADDPTASERVDAYNVDVCGLDADQGTDLASDLDPGAGPIRDQLVETLVAQGLSTEEATCVVDRIDTSDVTQLRDADVLADLVEECGIDLERLEGNG